MIELQGIRKSFGTSLVLNNLSFNIEAGGTCALLGLSGSGKTTAMKLICGLLTPDSGEIKVQNLIVTKENLSEVRSRLGYVIQDGGLFPHLTAYQNIWLVGHEFQWTDEQIKIRIAELSDLTQISAELLNHYPRELSGGQRQRVGLMRALFRDPPILLLDEPLGALDPITRSELQVELHNLISRLRKTVLLVTHDLFEAGYLAQKILLLNEGRIVQQGSLTDLIRHPADAFVQRFVNSQQHPAVLE